MRDPVCPADLILADRVIGYITAQIDIGKPKAYTMADGPLGKEGVDKREA